MMKARLEQAAFIFQFQTFCPIKIYDRAGQERTCTVALFLKSGLSRFQQVISTWKVLEDTHQQK